MEAVRVQPLELRDYDEAKQERREIENIDNKETRATTMTAAREVKSELFTLKICFVFYFLICCMLQN